MTLPDYRPTLRPADAFFEAHQQLIAMWADQQPVDATAVTNMPLAIGRVQIGATVEPPTIWHEVTYFERLPGDQIATDRVRTTLTIDPDERITLSCRTETQDRTPDVNGSIAKRWLGSEVTAAAVSNPGMLKTIAGKVDILYAQGHA